MWSRRSRVRVPSLTPKEAPLTRGFSVEGLSAEDRRGSNRAPNLCGAAGELTATGAGIRRVVTYLSVARRRPYGTGSLSVRSSRRAGETWYAQIWLDGRRVKRALGPKRQPGSSDGLTRAQAERKLRQLLDQAKPPPAERLTVEEVGSLLLTHLEILGRKPSTLENYESYLRVHLVPFFGRRPLVGITREQVQRFVTEKIESGRSPKSVMNYVGFLHSIFAFAERRDLATSNPCKLVDKPRVTSGDGRIRFLMPEELDELITVAGEAAHAIAATDRCLYVTAALTGLRQGELLALRWRDLDWDARRIRVRESLVRGELTTPKSRRSSRSVPLPTRIAEELTEHLERSLFRSPEDLVFCHPRLGKALERSRLFRRFKEAAIAAGHPRLRFHDLRHTFGTRMAAAGIPMRTLQEWMGHRDFRTTLIYADYQPNDHEHELIDRALVSSDQK